MNYNSEFCSIESTFGAGITSKISKKMNRKLKLSLIDGNFSAEEAKEILINIYSTKINFHEMANFSSMERFGVENSIAVKRIQILRKNIEKIVELVEEMNDKNQNFIISSEIHIRLEDKL